MKAKSWHQIHKYLAIVAGLFLLVWTLSGIVMMMPMEWFEPTPLEQAQRVDYSQALISPAEAVERLEQEQKAPIETIGVELKTIHDRPVYEILAANIGSELIDAITGEPVQVTQKLAEQIVLDAVPTQAEIQSAIRIKNHNASYPFGELPVIRVVFSDQPSVYYYVTTRDGTVSKSNTLTRIRAAIVSLHTFEPVGLLTGSGAVRQGLLIVTAAIGVLVALTGYYIAILPVMRKRQRKTSGSRGSIQEDEVSQ